MMCKLLKVKLLQTNIRDKNWAAIKKLTEQQPCFYYNPTTSGDAYVTAHNIKTRAAEKPNPGLI